MIVGAHTVIYSANAEADRAFLRDVLSLPSVDAGEGWLIFGLPPAEVAFHPSERNDLHEFYIMCKDVHAFVARMRAHGVACTEVKDEGWGVLTHMTLPGGGRIGVYEARHARPKPWAPAVKEASATRAKKRSKASAAKKAAKKAPKRAKKTSKRPAARKTAKKARKKARRR